MIPQNIKSAIDNFKNKIVSDDELTELIDLINSAKLKGCQQVEVWEYFEKVQKDAEATIKAKEQAAYEKQLKQKQEAYKKRIQQEELKAKKKIDKEERTETIIYFSISILFPFGVVLFGDSTSLSWTLIFLGFLGTLVSLGGMITIWHNKKLCFRGLWLLLLYVILGYVGFRINGTDDGSVIETEKINYVTDDSIDTEALQTLLTNEFGQEYSFKIEVPVKGSIRIDENDVFVKIFITENTSQEKGWFYIVPNSNGDVDIWRSQNTTSMSSSIYKIKSSIKKWSEKNIKFSAEEK